MIPVAFPNTLCYDGYIIEWSMNMAERIVKWRANDGSEWDTREEAEACDARGVIARAIESMTTYGNVDPDELLQALTTGELGAMVASYRRT